MRSEILVLLNLLNFGFGFRGVWGFYRAMLRRARLCHSTVCGLSVCRFVCDVQVPWSHIASIGL